MTINQRAAVVFLARKAEGILPLQRFIKTYLEHDAGEPHDLIIVFKGYNPAEAELTNAKNILSAVPYDALYIDDGGIDITAYLHAAETIDHETVCFLNTFSEPDDRGWLRKLLMHLDREDVGLVGATASYESLQSSMDLLSKVVWLCAAMQIPYDDNLAKHYQWLLKSQYPSWLDKSGANSVWERLKGTILAHTAYKRYDKLYRTHWDTIIRPGGPVDWATLFPPFPNLHIRSNCFAMKRQTLLEFKFSKITEKMEGCAFESGRDSLTARINRSGKSALVVGKDGVGYNTADWPTSSTFRLGDQRNVMVTDNQVRNFRHYSPQERATHVLMTWGDYTEAQSPRPPNLGKQFARSKKFGSLGAQQLVSINYSGHDANDGIQEHVG